MPDQQDIDGVRNELLQAISAAITNKRPAAALQYAEAYAWLTSPESSHGDATKIDVTK